MTKALNFLPGTEIELLSVVERIENLDGRSNFLCKCACGNFCEVLGKKLNAALQGRGGSKKSCGCLSSWMSHTHALSDEKDIVGNKYGKLTVLSRSFHRYSQDHSSSYWECLCECGNKKIIARKHLITLNTISCGCVRLENSKKFIEKHSKRKFYDKNSLKKCSKCFYIKKCEEFHKKLDKFSSRCKSCIKVTKSS